MNSVEYYIAPKEEIFNEIKAKAIAIWQTYDDTYGYATEKLDRIKNIQNIKDNACYIVAMFDTWNQNRLFYMVDGEAKAWLDDLLTWSRKRTET